MNSPLDGLSRRNAGVQLFLAADRGMDGGRDFEVYLDVRNPVLAPEDVVFDWKL